MKSTKGIVLVACILMLGAMIVARGRASAPRQAPPTPTAARIATPSGRTTVNKGRVVLSTASSNRYVHASGGEVYLDVSLAGQARKQATRRLPVNVALVIDRSGSMSGKKIEDARAAARTVVAQLSDGDRLSIVIFDDVAELLLRSTVVSERSRDRMRAVIRTIRDRGSTNLWAGLDLARREALTYGRDGFVNRVVVISDGQANVGISDQKGISALARQALGQGVHVTAMGVGADFDAKMMTAIAEHGGGHYYFIDDSSAMARIFSSELQTLLATVAKSAELHLALAPGVELLDVLGYTFERRNEGREIAIHLPDIYGGLDRKVMCRLRVPAGKEGMRQLAKVSLSFTDAETNARDSAETVAAVALLHDKQQVEKGQDGEVMAKGEQAFAAQNLDKAMDEYERGNVGNAQGLLRKQIAATSHLNAKLKSKALDSLIGDMRGKLGQTATVAPSTEQGRMLVKAGKFRAYKAAK